MRKRTCAVDGCGKPMHGKTYCGMHYERNRVYGSPIIEVTSHPEIEPTFGNWLAGFIDGEGCFYIRRQPGWDSHYCGFRITLRVDDSAVIDEIAETTKLGVIRIVRPSKGNPMVTWSIRSRHDCLGLIAILDACPPRAKKKRDYTLWRRAVMAWVQMNPGANNHSGPNDWSEMATLRDELTEVRRFQWPTTS